jgi:hypothetical protein
VYPNAGTNCTYAGNVSVGAATAITFGTAAGGVASFVGTGGQSISTDPSTPAPIFTRLVVANTGSGVTLNNPVNVSVYLTLTAGLLNTSTTALLTMQNGSTTAAGTALSTSYVNGPMCYQKSSSGVSVLNFPVGTAPDCRPATLTVNHTNNTLYNYTIQVYNVAPITLGYTVPPTISALPTSHYYTLSRTNSAGVSQPNQNLSGNQTIELFYGANDNVVDGTAMSVIKNTYTATTAWIDIGGSGGPAFNNWAHLTGSIVSTSTPSAFNSFSTFALGTNLRFLLPVKLLFFKGQLGAGGVDLSWATSMESNNSGFTVEKSSDGVDFTPLRWVPTKADGGNSQVRLDYSTVDASPYAGVTYYRLVQTDNNGHLTYSDIVVVHTGETGTVTVYPNPSRGMLWINGLGSNLEKVRAVIYDVSGKPVFETDVAVQGGMAKLDTRLNNGMYLLQLQIPGGSAVVRNIVILR